MRCQISRRFPIRIRARQLRLLVAFTLLTAAFAAGEVQAADCNIDVRLSIPALPLHSGDAIKVTVPSPNHITSLKVEVGVQQMAPPDFHRIAPDGSLNLVVGSDSHADIILDPQEENFQYVTVTVQDGGGNCGVTRGRAKIRTTDSAAIVIGVDKTQATNKDLSFAQADALAIIKHLVEGLQLKSKNIWFLTQDVDHTATPYIVNRRELVDGDSISSAIAEVATRTDRNAKIYFYFSGHQYVRPKENERDLKPNYYFVLPNSIATPQHLTSMYSWDALENDLIQIDHRVIIAILDSCYSGSVSADFPTVPAPVALTSTAASAESAANDTGVSKQMGVIALGTLPPKATLNANALMTSSSEDQPSWEFKKLGHGVFTAFLLRVGDQARTDASDITLHQMFYEVHLKDTKGNGVREMTIYYDPGDSRIKYEQTPFAVIDSQADGSLWAHYKKN